MPYLKKAEEWLAQSKLLLLARPSTTRITTKYRLLKPKDASRKEKSSSKPTTDDNAPSPALAAAPEPVRASITLKTYDPASGTTLKYRTSKAAEVSRLVQILGRLGRPMAGLPEEAKEDVAMVDTPVEAASGAATPVVAEGSGPAGGKPGQGGGGAKKGKKKGKK